MPTQHVIEQSAVRILPNGDICAQFTVNLPARGRSIQGYKAVQIFDQTLPQLVQKSLIYTSLDANVVTRHVLNVEDQEWVRSNLEIRGLVAFVPDGAVLPRMSGADDRPMDDTVNDGDNSKLVRFHSPDTLRVSFDLPNMGKTLAGIGIRKGITLIVGGGFHGKSTLLSALQVGMYNVRAWLQTLHLVYVSSRSSFYLYFCCRKYLETAASFVFVPQLPSRSGQRMEEMSAKLTLVHLSATCHSAKKLTASLPLMRVVALVKRLILWR